MKIIILLFSVSFILFDCTPKSPQKITGTTAEKAMVVSARKEASEIGVQILQKGGNAFDAMMATGFALAVAYPVAGNIGGGGFMVYRMADGSTGALDYREKAPLAAMRDMYLDSEGNVIKGKSTVGSTAVGVPGAVAGLFEAQRKYGKLSVEEILTPVIALAKNGVIVTKKQEKRIGKYQSVFREVNPDFNVFKEGISENDTIKYPALATTLERIAKNGRDEFYKGETAQKFIQFMQKSGGIITLEDLERYRAKWR